MFSHVKCAWATCHSRRLRRNPCVFSCKMRLGFVLIVNLHVIPAHPGEIVLFPAKGICLGFILIVNLYVTDDPPPPTRLFFNENARCTNPHNVFSNNMHLAFKVIVNLHVTRPTAPGFRIIFLRKTRVATNPSRFRVFFSSKTRLAFNVTGKLI